MVRRARIVIPGVAHHVTQRGNNRQDVFFTDDDRRMYLDILENTFGQFGLHVQGYCLMTNHVHLLMKFYHVESFQKVMQCVFRGSPSSHSALKLPLIPV